MLIRAKSLSAMKPLTDQSHGRWALGAIALERETDSTVCAVVTDARSLLVVRHPQPCAEELESAGITDPLPQGGADTNAADARPILIDPKHLAAIAKDAKPDKGMSGRRYRLAAMARIDEPSANGTVRIEPAASPELGRTVPAVEGRFPRWRDVIPDTSGAVLTMDVDPRRLAAALTALADATPDDADADNVRCTVTVYQSKGPFPKPTTLRIDRKTADGTTATAVVMLLTRD